MAVLLAWQLATGAIIPTPAMASTATSTSVTQVSLHCHDAQMATGVSDGPQVPANCPQNSHGCHTACCTSGCLSSCGAISTTALVAHLMPDHSGINELRCPARVQRFAQHFRPPI
jgi:hypothetical protein